MVKGTPAIACVGVISRRDDPLYVGLFPEDQRDELEYHYMLSTCLDIFRARLPSQAASHDFGLLQIIDETLAIYGWLTNTGVKFVIIVDLEGRPVSEMEGGEEAARRAATVGVKDADVRPAFRALHQAYIRLLRNPFYDPDGTFERRIGNESSGEITSPSFISEVYRIVQRWAPGMTSV